VKEEVTVGKRTVTDHERVSGDVRKENIRVENKGDADIRGCDPKSR
jgi:stress response protein YsnF